MMDLPKRLGAGLLAACSMVLIAPALAAADDFTVNDDTTGVGPAGATCAAPDFNEIQAAIDGAANGDRILVCAGSYNETVDVDKRLSLQGAQAGNDARTRTTPAADESVITGDGAAQGGVTTSVDDTSLDGFVIEETQTPQPAGGFGLIQSSGTGDHRVVNTIFQANASGMYLTNKSGQGVVRRNLFDDNNEGVGVVAAAGNGIYADFGVENAKVDKNLFTEQDNAAAVITEVTGRNADLRITDNEVLQSRGFVLIYADDVVFSGNTVESTDSGDGNGAFSALYLEDTNDAVVGDNSISEASTAVRVASAFVGGTTTDLVIVGNTLTDNDYGVRISDGGVSGDTVATGNRIVGNATAGVANEDAGEGVSAENNWWGCNEGPGQAGCDTTEGEVNTDPWLVLSVSTNKPRVPKGLRSTVKLGLTTNSDGAPVVPSLFPDGTTIDLGATGGKVKPSSVETVEGAAKSKYRAKQIGTQTITATLDNEDATTTIKVKKK